MIDTAYALAGALTGFVVGLTGVGVTCPGLLGPSVVRISTWHQGEGHAKEEDLTRADHFSAAAD